MEYLTITNICLAFSGMLLHILIKIQKVKTVCKENGERFSLKKYLSDNLIAVLISIISVVALLAMFKDVLSLFGLEMIADQSEGSVGSKLTNLYGIFSFIEINYGKMSCFASSTCSCRNAD